MQPGHDAIIAKPLRRAGSSIAFGGAFAAAILIGGIALIYYAREGLTLSHYDARAHMVVARRVVDSLTPGWRQFGAVWLPLPHLILLLPVQVDWIYRTGYAAALLSTIALAGGLASLASTVYRRTRSAPAAIVAPLLILLNPDVLYLQSTPMTEPLLFGLSLLAVTAVDRWAASPDLRHARGAGWVLALLVWTRYEGWCIAAALVMLAAALSRGRVRPVAAMAGRPLAAIMVFLALSWASTGRWFVSSGFFVPDNPSAHHAARSFHEVWATSIELGGSALIAAGGAGAVCLIVRRAGGLLALLALAAAGALPFAAFYEGHPHRVRYMVPLVVAAGALTSAAIAALPRRIQAIAAALTLALVLWQRPPFDARAPMVLEAQWETPFRLQREAVTAYLRREWDHTPMLASMGSLGHYMQESSAAGIQLKNFLHEGNGDLWIAALDSPRAHVNWVLVEERAEGGDLLFARSRADPAFLSGFTRVAEGGGVALYRRSAR
jgi:hypothetical protein